MKIKEITITDVFGVNHTTEIFILGTENFNEVRSFILHEHSLMENLQLNQLLLMV